MKKQPKTIRNFKCWCYFAPNGWPQVRTIAETRKESRQRLEEYDNFTNTWQNYEEEGYYISKADFSLIPKSNDTEKH